MREIKFRVWDKHGEEWVKEIYEGDIVKFPYTYPDEISTSGTSTRFDKVIVKFENLSFEPLEVLRYLVEIIGNIYENKNLLDNTDVATNKINDLKNRVEL